MSEFRFAEPARVAAFRHVVVVLVDLEGKWWESNDADNAKVAEVGALVGAPTVT